MCKHCAFSGLEVMSLDFRSLFESLYRGIVASERHKNRLGETEGCVGTRGLGAGVKMCWLSAHLWSCACKNLCLGAV